MKYVLSLLALALAVSAQANTTETTFKANTVIPMGLRQVILNAVQTRCGEYVMPYGLNETKSELTTSFYDFGYSEHHYKTTFSSENYSGDGYHPEYADIVVESSTFNDGMGHVEYMVDSVVANGWICQ